MKCVRQIVVAETTPLSLFPEVSRVLRSKRCMVSLPGFRRAETHESHGREQDYVLVNRDPDQLISPQRKLASKQATQGQ